MSEKECRIREKKKLLRKVKHQTRLLGKLKKRIINAEVNFRSKENAEKENEDGESLIHLTANESRDSENESSQDDDNEENVEHEPENADDSELDPLEMLNEIENGGEVEIGSELLDLTSAFLDTIFSQAGNGPFEMVLSSSLITVVAALALLKKKGKMNCDQAISFIETTMNRIKEAKINKDKPATEEEDPGH